MASAPVTVRSSSTTSIVLGECDFTFVFLSRQVDPDSSPFAEVALNGNFACVFFDNLFSVWHPETETAGLISVEGFEDLHDSLGSHSRSCVLYFQRERFSSSGGSDAQGAAGRHRLNRIEKQVQQGGADASLIKHSRCV